eukprot:jgi/Ulvmu1/579/UM001_0587.1
MGIEMEIYSLNNPVWYGQSIDAAAVYSVLLSEQTGSVCVKLLAPNLHWCGINWGDINRVAYHPIPAFVTTYLIHYRTCCNCTVLTCVRTRNRACGSNLTQTPIFLTTQSHTRVQFSVCTHCDLNTKCQAQLVIPHHRTRTQHCCHIPRLNPNLIPHSNNELDNHPSTGYVMYTILKYGSQGGNWDMPLHQNPTSLDTYTYATLPTPHSYSSVIRCQISTFERYCMMLHHILMVHAPSTTQPVAVRTGSTCPRPQHGKPNCHIDTTSYVSGLVTGAVREILQPSSIAPCVCIKLPPSHAALCSAHLAYIRLLWRLRTTRQSKE